MDIGKWIQYIRLHKYIWKAGDKIYSDKIQRKKILPLFFNILYNNFNFTFL